MQTVQSLMQSFFSPSKCGHENELIGVAGDWVCFSRLRSILDRVADCILSDKKVSAESFPCFMETVQGGGW